MSTLITKEIAARLRQAREQQGKSQSEVARALGMSQATVQKIEIGEARQSKFVEPLCTYLKVSLNEKIHRGQGPEVGAAVLERLATEEHLTTGVDLGSDWVNQVKALDVVAVKYSLGHSPDGKRTAVLITWTLPDGSNICGAIDVTLLQRSEPEFRRVARAAGIDLDRMSGKSDAA